MPSLTWIKA